MKRTLIIFLALAGFAAHAQKAGKDRRVAGGPGSQPRRVSILFTLANEYYAKEQYDSAVLYFRQSIELARGDGNDSMLMEALARHAQVLTNINGKETAIRELDTAISYARALGARARLMFYLGERAKANVGLLRTDGVLRDCRESMNIADSLHNKMQQARIYYALGLYYGNINSYSIQIDYLNRGIAIYDSLGRADKSADNYRLISICYAKQKKYKEALRYALITDSMDKALGLNYDRNALQMNIAVIYKNLGDYDKAIKMNLQALDSLKGNVLAQTVIYSNLGIAQSLKGLFEDAQRSFHTALDMNRAMDIAEIDAENYKELARAFLRVKQVDSALYYAVKGEQLCKEHRVPFETYLDCVSTLGEVYAAKDNVAQAHVYDRLYAKLLDSMYQGILASNLADAETRFNLSEKNKELSVLTTENELQRVKGQRLRISLVLGALIVLIIIIVYRRTARKNVLLQQQKQALAEQKEVLARQKETLSEQKDIINAQVVQLEAAASMKARFLANISHELRTPVTLLTGMLELTKDRLQNKAPIDGDKIAVALNNSRKLQHMIEEILDLSRVEQKEAELNIKVKEAGPLLKRIVYTFETLIHQKELTLTYDDSKGDSAYVAVDEDKFEKIINNLIYNAIKFNKTGGAIDVQLVADGKQVQVLVSDTGVGIRAEDQAHVFERFYQGAAPNKAKSEGVGIGLSLVKEFTALLGGAISVSSQVGKGTTFVLTFPAAVKTEQQSEEDTDAMPVVAWQELGGRSTVLVVEDNAEMRYYLREVLGAHVHVAEAANGAEALSWLEQNRPDLIISDLMMPEVDGREFVTRIKANDTYNKIPVIMLTAMADTENLLSLLRLGVDDYMVKPFNADELRIRVYNLLRNLAMRTAFNAEPKEADDVIISSDEEAGVFREKIKAYVHANLKTEQISVTDMAAELLLSERQLYRLARSLTGCSPAQLIKEVRLQKAYELLLNGDVTKVADVARRVGFENSSRFSRDFMERFGKRPGELLG